MSGGGGGGAPRRPGLPVHAVLGPALLAAGLLLPALALRSSWPPDETRYADVARHMAEGGSLVLPYLHGEPYDEKPPVFFWTAAAVQRGGVPVERAGRAVSTASGVALVALVPVLGAALGLPAAASVRGAWVLATTPLLLVHAQLGMLDTFLALLVALAAGAKLARADSRGARRALWTAGEGVLLGGALLTKGPVALLFAAGLRAGGQVAGPRSPARVDRSDLVVLGVALALGGAWLAAAAAAAGVDYAGALGVGQLLRRTGLASGGEVPHPAAPGELWLDAFAWCLPWSLVALGPLWRPVRSALRAGSPGAGRALAPAAGWLALPALVLGLLPSQQVQYLLPALPAAALGVGVVLAAPLPRALAVGLRGLAAALGAALLGFAVAAGAILAPLDLRSEVRAVLVDDAMLRAGLAAAGAVLLAMAARPRPAGAALWRRAAAGAAVVFAAAVAVTWRADAVISGDPILRHPILARAGRVLTPESLRSGVNLAAGREDTGHLKTEELLDEYRVHPDVVALVWEKEMDELQPGAEAVYEPVASGCVMGRRLLALRPRPGARPQPASPRASTTSR